jgi:hypothetical protein
VTAVTATHRAVAALRVRPVLRTALPGGIGLVAARLATVPLVELRLVVPMPVGSAAARARLMVLAATLDAVGAGPLRASGGGLRVTAGNDQLLVEAYAPAAALPTALAALHALLTVVPGEAEVATARAGLAARLPGAAAQPLLRTRAHLLRAVFGDRPEARELPTAAELDAVTAAEVVATRAAVLTPGRVTVVLVGDLDPAHAAHLAATTLPTLHPPGAGRGDLSGTGGDDPSGTGGGDLSGTGGDDPPGSGGGDLSGTGADDPSGTGRVGPGCSGGRAGSGGAAGRDGTGGPGGPRGTGGPGGPGGPAGDRAAGRGTARGGVEVVQDAGPGAAHLRLAVPLPPGAAPAALELAAGVLGGPARWAGDVHGIAYDPVCVVQYAGATGLLTMSADGTAARAAGMVAATAGTLGRLAVDPPGAQEVAAARAHAVGRLVLSVGSQGGYAATLAALIVRGAGPDGLDAHLAALDTVPAAEVAALAADLPRLVTGAVVVPPGTTGPALAAAVRRLGG